MTRDPYYRIWNDPVEVRRYLEPLVQTMPELLPNGVIVDTFTLKKCDTSIYATLPRASPRLSRSTATGEGAPSPRQSDVIATLSGWAGARKHAGPTAGPDT